MQAAFLHRSFNGGEISPLMLSRIDHPKYHTGCKTMKNTVCLPQGAATRRPGWRFIGEAKEQRIDYHVRLIPFVFSETESRVLEFGDNYMRVWSGDDLIESSEVDNVQLQTSLSHTSLPSLSIAQSADIIYCATRDNAPSKIMRYADDDWQQEVLSFLPANDAPHSLIATPTVGTESVGEATYKYVVTQVNDGEESLPSDPISTTTDILSQSQGNYITLDWSMGGTKTPEKYYIYKDYYGEYGYIGQSEEPTFKDDNIAADTTDSPPSDYNPFTDTDTYPALVFFSGQRLGWASSLTQPFTTWLSTAGELENLGLSTSSASDEAIEATLATTQANQIIWAAGENQILLATANSVWTLAGIDSEELLNFKKQGGDGSAAIQPVIIGGSLLYILQGGRGMGELSYSYDSERYEMMELSILSEHVFNGKKVAGWCVQKNPYSVVWIYFTDGTYAGMTYLKTHEIIGFHQHETDGFIESMCCVPGDDYDRVNATIIRTIGGVQKRYIECMEKYFIESDDISDAFFVDSGVTYEGDAKSVLTAIAPHLAGKTVKIWADGKEQSEKVVSPNGSVFLDTTASKVHLGLGYLSDIVPTRPEIESTQSGTTFSRVYKVSNAHLNFYKSADVQVGADSDYLETVLDNSSISNDIQRAEVYVDTGWTGDWNFLVRASGAAPMTLTSIVYNTEISEEL